jgi:hypothetical protein
MSELYYGQLVASHNLPTVMLTVDRCRLPAQPLRPQADLKRNVTPDAPRRCCWPTRAVEAGRGQSGQPEPITSSVDGGVSPVRNRWYPTRLNHVLLVGFSS